MSIDEITISDKEKRIDSMLSVLKKRIMGQGGEVMIHTHNFFININDNFNNVVVNRASTGSAIIFYFDNATEAQLLDRLYQDSIKKY